MHCRICGDENNVKLVGDYRGFLCPSCAAYTPKKVSFDKFKSVYFADEPEVFDLIAREFYDDYKSSGHTLDEYIAATTYNLI